LRFIGCCLPHELKEEGEGFCFSFFFLSSKD